MAGLLKLKESQRKIIIEQAAQKSGILAKAIEKDYWVTIALKALFISKYKDYLVFKGGTSLSKCWGYIERFSEDIDLGLDPQVFGMEHDTSPNGKYLKKLRENGYKFISTELKAELERQFDQLEISQSIKIFEEPRKEGMSHPDPHILYIQYSSLFDPNPYLANQVKIELSVRTLKEPKTNIPIQSLVYQSIPNDAYKENPFDVIVVEPHRTFLEKIFLLHEEFQKPDVTKIKSERMSRHLYDIERMMDKEPGKKALQDTMLYEQIIEHRSTYNAIPGVDYNSHSRDKITFIPPKEILEAYSKDYATMREAMIYGDSPEFTELVKRLNELLSRFRSLS